MRLFRNLPALFALVCATTGQGADPIYKKVGDSVVLNPGQPLNAISSATWKHNTDLASEWFGTGNVDCYRDFKGRCSLNKTDGSFTISNLKVEDSGSYTPEINDKVLTAVKLQVIKPVPKPTVSVKCNNEKTLCNLTCEANVSAEFGLVIYRWRKDREVVLSNNKELIITTENMESSFICELENPVSRNSSDGVDIPLSRGNPGAWAGLAVAIVFLIVVLAVVGRVVYYKRKKGQYAPVPRKDTNTKKNHEPNGGQSTPTVQIINEKEDEATPSDDEDTDETSNLELCEGANQNTPPVNPVPSGPTEDNDSPNNGKKTDDQHQKPAEESPIENQGDFSTVEQTTKASEGEASPREKDGDDAGSAEGKELLHDASKKSDLEAKIYKDQERNAMRPTETLQIVNENASEKPKDPDCDPSIVPGMSISESSKGANQNTPPVNPVPSGPPEDNDSPNNCKITDDQHQKSAEESPIENQGDSGTVEQLTKASETNISGSSEEDEQNHPVSDPVTSVPTEGEASPSNKEEKDGSEPKTNNHETNGGRSTTTEQNTSKDEGEASPREEDDQDQKSAEKSPSKNQGDSSTVEQNNKESDTCNLKSAKAANQNVPSVNPVPSGPTDVKAPSSDEEKDGQGKESAEKSSGVKLGEQHLNSNPNRIQQPNDGTEDKTPSSNDKNRDNLHQKSAEEPSIVKLGDSNPEGKTFKGSDTSNLESSEGANQKPPFVNPGTGGLTENSSVEPSGPETSEEVSAV